MRGKAAPPDKDFWYAAERSYQLNPNPILDGFQLIKHSPTLSVWKEGNRFLIGIRGTNIKDLGDIDADISLVMNKLTKTGRYKKDKKMLEDLFRQYPPAQNEYYLAAHSLSGAISNQLKAEFPFIREAVEFNPAFQPVDFLRRRGDIKRYYIDSDPLYKLGGRFLANTKVYPAGQTSNNIIADALSGHKLSNFKPIVGGELSLPGVLRRRERVTTEEQEELMRAEQDDRTANEIINYVANNYDTIFATLSNPFSALFRFGRRYLIECLTNYFTRAGLTTRLRGIVKRFLLVVLKTYRRMRGGRQGETPTPPRRVPSLMEVFALLGAALELDNLYPNRFTARFLDNINDMLRETQEGNPNLITIYDALTELIGRLQQVARDPRKY